LPYGLGSGKDKRTGLPFHWQAISTVKASSETFTLLHPNRRLTEHRWLKAEEEERA